MHPKSRRIYLTFLIMGTSIFLLEMFYFIRVFKKRFRENQEIEQVMISSGLSAADTWVKQRAFFTRDSILKLRENTCKIPILNPFVNQLVQFFSPYLNLTCDGKFYFSSHVKNQDFYTKTSENMIIVKRDVPPSFMCCYVQVQFSQEHPYKSIGPTTDTTDDCQFFTGNNTVIPSNSQYIMIHCWNTTNPNNLNVSSSKFSKNKTDHWELLFYLPQPSTELLQLKNEQLTKQNKRKEDLLNVIILGFDQISRQNFIRLLGKSFNYLRTELDAIDLQGFNKVGDATLNNTLALLTGHDFGDIVKNPNWWQGDGFFDECPWIMKNFSEGGFLTSYAEDYKSVFSFRFKGFKKQPTDYYMEPFMNWYTDWWEDRWKKFGNFSCIGNMLALDLMQDHAQKFSASVNHPYFQFMWIGRTHNDRVGYPALADKGTLKTLKYFQNSGVLNRSLVILVSDHGTRYENIMLNAQARLENKLSFAFLILPQWFKEKYSVAYQNIKENQYGLTTPYDIHSTLIDVINPSERLSNEMITKRKYLSPFKGNSLFLPISKERTCQDAGIDEEWCACTSYKNFSKDSDIAYQLSNYAVKTINSWLVSFPLCQQYTLDSVISAEIKVPPEEAHPLINLFDKQQFRVAFGVQPRDARFEVTIFTEKGYWRSGGDDKIWMSTEIFRFSRYFGANCISDNLMRKICTCK